MAKLDGRVCVITGAGRGLGREYALLMAAEGARVVVNDVGGTTDGVGSDATAAQLVVDEIRESGGEAVASTDSVADWDGSKRIIDTAIGAFGELDAVVTNAGILRDRMVVSMEEDEWDAVLAVHLKGTFCTVRHAAAFWRERAKQTGAAVDAAVVCTTSAAGLHNNFGQASYGAAKAGIAAFAQIAAKELQRYGVRVNTVSPAARTRLTEAVPGMDEMVAAPTEEGAFDFWDPANVAPVVAYLAGGSCPLTGSVWHVVGGQIGLEEGWRIVAGSEKEGRWTIEELEREVPLIVAGRGADVDGALASEGHNVEEALAALVGAGVR
jgi:NAD(P)-dependent dehydrogenase (short-subunit alcohol dehydrogenase family)